MAFDYRAAWEMALLAQVAYAEIDGGFEAGPFRQQLVEEVGLSQTSINYFFANFRYVQHSTDSLTGYDALLFERIDASGAGTGQYYLLNRGTEFSPFESGIDPMDLFEDGAAFLTGEVLAQSGSMDAFYQSFAADLLGEADPGATLTVLGHSLGGHLSTLFALDNPGDATVWTFNPMGVDRPLDLLQTHFRDLTDLPNSEDWVPTWMGRLTTLVGLAVRLIPHQSDHPDVQNVILDEGPEFANYIGGLYGEVFRVQGGEVEDQFSPIEAHSAANLTDTLMLASIYHAIDPTLSSAQIGRLLHASSAEYLLDRDQALESVARLFGLDFAATSDAGAVVSGDVENFDAAYYALKQEAALDLLALLDQTDGGFSVIGLLSQTHSELLQQVTGADPLGARYRHAVLEQMPFTLSGDVPYLNGLDSDPAYAAERYSVAQWQARVSAFVARMEANLADRDWAHGELLQEFMDLASSETLRSTPSPLAGEEFFQKILFGQDVDETISGAGLGDYLFGNAGSDQLLGLAGDDFLEGAAGSDQLFGGAGADTLIGGIGADELDGGLGDDQLHGGSGADRYRFQTGDGHDVIWDVDQADRILINGTEITAVTEVEAVMSGLYQDASHRYVLLADRLRILVNGALDPASSDVIDVMGWDAVQNRFGITLADAVTYPWPGAEADALQVGSGELAYTGPDGSITHELHTHQSQRPDWINQSSLVYFADAYAAYDPVLHDFNWAFYFEGGDSADALTGGRFRDHLYGGDGDDALRFTDGDNIAEGGRGSDQIQGGAGNDLLWGTRSGIYEASAEPALEEDFGDVDRIDGGAGIDWLSAGSGADVLLGGLGDDVVDGGAGNDVLQGGQGADQIFGDSRLARSVVGEQVFTFHDWIESVDPGLSYDDLIDAGDGNDVVFGEAGHDTLIGGLGDDLLMGDRINDAAWYFDALANPADDYRALPGTLHGEDHLFGGEGADQLYGNGGADQLNGGAGDDQIWGDDDVLALGLHGDDRIDAGTGNDQVSAGGGDDRVHAGDGQDVVYGNSGDDFLYGDAGDDFLYGDDFLSGSALHGRDVLRGGAGMDQLVGNGGNDQLFGEAGDDSLFGSDGDDQLDGGEGNDQLSGESGADQLQGGPGDDRIWGGAGNDTLSGGAGSDELYGGAGNDVYRISVEDGSNRIGDVEGLNTLRLLGVRHASEVTASQGEGFTTFEFGRLGASVRIDHASFAAMGRIELQDGSLYTVALSTDPDDPEPLRGSGAGDVLHVADSLNPVYGNGGDDLLAGGVYADQLRGGNGDDVVLGGEGGDYLYGDAGNDRLYGADGADSLRGGEGDDWIYGQDGGDWLYGDAGSDVLRGGAGNDRLYGGAGDDRFVFAAGDGLDTLYVFGDEGLDTLVLETASGIDDIELRMLGTTLRVLLRGSEDYVSVPGFASATGLLDSIEFAAGFGSLASSEFDAYFEAATDVDDRIWAGWGGAVTIDGLAGDDQLWGGGYDDTLSGSAGDDRITGDAGNDVLLGGTGADQLFGHAGDDVLDGGAGDDQLQAGYGDDTIRFGLGAGIDTLLYDGDLQGQDRIELEPGIVPEDIEVSLDNDDVLALRINGQTDQLLLNDFASAGAVHAAYLNDLVYFSDGTVWTAGDLWNLRLLGSAGDDRITGEANPELLTGQAGNDVLLGGSGDDILDGGSGDDSLFGMAGDDIYRFGIGYGSDVINNHHASPASDLDRIELQAGISPDDVILRKDYSSNLLISFAGATDSLRVEYYFSSSDSNYRVDEIVFTDLPGEVWTQEDIEARRLLPSAGDDLLLGNDTADSIFGGAGDDVLRGLDGMDVLDGGTGNDQLIGGNESDTYLFGSGYGHDEIFNRPTSRFWYNAVTGEPVLQGRVQFGDGIAPADVRVIRQDGDLIFSLNNGEDTLNVKGFFVDGYKAIESASFANGVRWDYDELRNQLLQGTELDDVITGYDDAADNFSGHGGDDVLDGLGGADQIRGGSGDDQLVGGSGNDTLLGETGNDHLDGGTGRDTLDGGAGSDVYVFGFGSGHDLILNHDESDARFDVILMQTDVTPAAVRIQRVGADLWLELNQGLDRLTVPNHFSGKGKYRDHHIDAVQFSDGTVWDREALLFYAELDAAGNYQLTGDALDNLIEGLGGDDLLSGGGGSDRLFGGDGDDILEGGIGDDWLNAGPGDDVYRFNLGDGAEQIQNAEVSPLAVDVIELGPGLTAMATTLTRVGDDLEIRFSASDQIRVLDWYAGVAGDNRIDELRFSDGTVWTADEMELLATPNLAPIAGVDQFSMAEDQTLQLSFSDLLQNDTDPEGDELILIDAHAGSGGQLTLDAEAETLSFSPNPDFFGSAGFSYTVSDGRNSVVGNVQVEVSAIADAPLANGDAFSVERDQWVDLPVAALLANDQDADGDALSIVSVHGAENGVATLDIATGLVRFTPVAGYTGPAGFEYQLSDGALESTGEVLVQVFAPNHAPNTQDDAVATVQGQAIDISFDTLLANDFDADGDALDIVAVGQVMNGTISLDSEARLVTFVPDAYHTGSGSFVVSVSDGVTSVPGSVTVSIDPDLSSRNSHAGTDASDQLSGGSRDDALYGLGGDDVLDGGRGDDQLHGGAGNDRLLGGAGDDRYIFGSDSGMDVIDNTTAKSGDLDQAWFTGGVESAGLWFSRDGANLVIDVLETESRVTVEGWYADIDARLASVHADAQVLPADGAETLVDAMAGYAKPVDGLSQTSHAELLPVLTQVWAPELA